MRVDLCLAVLMLTSGVAVAQTPTTDQPANAKPVKAKRVCRSVTKTGSRLPDSVCHTQAEWDQIAQAGANADQNSTALAPH